MSVTERLAGFERAMKEADLSVRPGWMMLGDYSRSYGRSAAAVLLDAPVRPTAILACSDYIAIGVMQAVRARGLVIPDDLSLVGFDDMAFAELVDPPLTTVRAAPGRDGTACRSILLALIDGGAAPPAETRLPVDLIIRDFRSTPFRKGPFMTKRILIAGIPGPFIRSIKKASTASPLNMPKVCAGCAAHLKAVAGR